MAERSPGQKIRHSSKEIRNGGFGCFQGSLTTESENSLTSDLHTDLVTIAGIMTSDLQVLMCN